MTAHDAESLPWDDGGAPVSDDVDAIFGEPSIPPGVSPVFDVNTRRGLALAPVSPSPSPSPPTSRALPLATFKHAKDNQPAPSTMTVDAFAAHCAALVCEPLVPVTDLVATDVDAGKTAKGKGPAFSPVRYRAGTKRSKANVDAVSAYVVDLDGVTADVVDAFWSALAARGVRAFGWTTWSHGSDHKPGSCWRAVVPFSSDVDAADWPGLWLLLSDDLAQGHNDPSTKDASRLHFLPRAPSRVLRAGVVVGNDKPQWRELPGVLFDPLPLVQQARTAALAPAPSTTKATTPKPEAVPSKAAEKRPDRVTRARAWLASAAAAVAGSDGHATAMRVVGSVVRGFDLDNGDAMFALADWNRGCVPPWSEAELRHKVADAQATPDPDKRARGWLLSEAPRRLGLASPARDDEDASDGDMGSKPGKRTHADRAVELCDGMRFVRSENGEPFAVIAAPAVVPLRSSAFMAWLSSAFYDRHQRVPSTSAIKAAVTVLEGQALRAEQAPVFVRVGELDGARFLDLGQDVVRIDATGWRVDPSPPVLFWRPASAQPLPQPTRGGSVDDLRRFVRVDADGWALLLTWLVAALSPMTSGTFPILLLHGTHGTAKSTTARLMRQLVDPSASPTRRPPQGTRNLVAAAKNTWVINLDNVSSLAGDLSDDLATLTSGGGFEQRSLHTTDDLALYRVKRPVIVNGIGDFASRSDFLSRALLVELQPFTPGERRSDADLDAAFTAVRPAILGALLDGVVAGLASPSPSSAPTEGRCVDAERMATAAESTFGLPTGAVRRALASIDSDRVAIALDGWPVFAALEALLERNAGRWRGSATELLAVLNRQETTTTVNTAAGWPRSANTLSGQLARHDGDMRARGLIGQRIRTKAGSLITLTMSNTDDDGADTR